jgi:hypothetical protein
MKKMKSCIVKARMFEREGEMWELDHFISSRLL